MSSLSWHYLEQPFLVWKNALGSGRKRAPEPRRLVLSSSSAAQA
jgi:hypothetical protein